MKRNFLVIETLILCNLIILTPASFSAEFSGYLSTEGIYFFKKPLFDKQERNTASIALQPEFYHEWENGSSFTFVPFGRLDSADEERSHVDIRELNYLFLSDNYELRIGLGKVFWGATEFVHLVDIINQTDLVENMDEEEKLGQPMLQLTMPKSWGTAEFFLLPYFRERTFPGEEGRLRTGLMVDTDEVVYESSSRERHIDYALRYSHTLGDMDMGIYHFMGTGREPALHPGINKSGKLVLIPFYEQIEQTGLDIQFVAGEWLWKLETLHRSGQGEAFYASIGGFEYTFYGIADGPLDLGVIVEYAYDDRGDEATTAYENDAMVGLRIAFNDAAGSEILAGYMDDLESSAHIISIEASRRFGEHVKISLKGRSFSSIPADDPVYSLRDDDYMKLELAYYF
ncbi:MAG: hypothetical protein OEV42_02365 [Deltaproteobacteria bacterium]|nr:hypothetical protein [Deltaproteobacteria bacterium]